MTGYQLHPEAYDDIDEIRAYIAEDNPDAADRMVNEIFNSIQFARKHLVADAHIHPPSAEGDQRNYHVHILVASRTIGPDGFGEKFLKWEDYGQQLDQWRDKWAERGAKELEKAGFHLEAERWRVGHLDLERQRQSARERGDLAHLETLNREPTTHRGPTIDAMEKKGQQTERGNIHRDIEQRDQDAAALKIELAKIQWLLRVKPYLVISPFRTFQLDKC